MSIFWWLLSLVFIVLLIGQAGSLARDRRYGVGADDDRGLGKSLTAGGEPMPMSSGQARCVAALRVAGCIGLVIIWTALVSVFIHLGGSHLAQLWRDSLAAQALALSLLYTSLVLVLMRTQIVVGPYPSRLRRYGLALHAFMMFLFFVAAIDALIEHS
jgi:hypothetical protein